MSWLSLWRAVGGAACASGLPRALMPGRDVERSERLGEAPATGGEAPLWVHAASVGETIAAASLVRAVRQLAPRPVALSTTTATGRERAHGLHPDFGPFHAPLDAPGPVTRAIERLRPAGYVALETELWPVLLDELARRNVPWGIASGRLSPRSFARMRWIAGLYRHVLRTATAIAPRTEDDAARFLALGAPPDAVRVTGDLKEDREAQAWEAPPSGGPRWIAACTRPGEEPIVLEALALLAAERAGGELALAPRHPERFAEVEALCRRTPFAVRSWRERAAAAPPGWSILLVDEMGVLDEAYRRASCAFVGGSLVALGGHSPWEAAAAGRPVITGPHVATCGDAVMALRVAGAAGEVRSAAELAAAVTTYLADPSAVERAGRAAQETLRARSGAGRATVAFFLERGLLR
ncbi:MAG: glycosyltransferase N-terminal domain-containing protein [bacterium]